MRTIKLITFSLLLFLLNQVRLSAQCGDCLGFVSASVTDTQLCAGGVVQITSQGSPAAYYNDFNGGTIGVGWSINFTPQFNNPCDPSPDGTPYCWMGSSTTAPRILSTIDFNVSAGGNISFDFDMATQGNGSPCEGPDLQNEGIYLDYSTDGGATWDTIFYFDPTPLGTYVSWANYSFPIPIEAQTPCTRFRWAQTSSSAAVNDHWGLDNIQIGPSAGGAYSLYWQGNPSFPTDTTTSLTVTSDTTMILVLQTLVDTCYDTLNIHVIPLPNADVVVSNPYCIGDPITFNAAGSTPAIDITNYLYDLDNNGTYEIITPGSTYNPPGSFSGTAGNKPVNMIVQTAEPGCADTINTVVQIYNSPTLGLTVTDPTVCIYNNADFQGLAFMFNPAGQTSTVTNYEWDFDFNGTTDTSGATLTNVSNLFPGLGTYPVILTVTSNIGCEKSDTVNVTIVDIPHGNIIAPQVCGNEFASISFNSTGLPITSYDWNLGDPTVTTDVSTNSSPSYLYPAPGVYGIIVVVGTADGCLDTMVTSINIDPLPAGSITNTEVCQNLTESFVFVQTSTDSITNYNWNFVNGNPIFSNLAAPTVEFAFGGPINISVAITNQYGCTDTIFQPFIVHPTPIAGIGVYPICISRFTFDPLVAPNDETVVIDWNLGDGTVFNDMDTSLFNHIYTEPGDYIASLIVTDQYGCIDTATQLVQVDDSLFITMPNVLVQSSTVENDKVDMDKLSPGFNLCIDYTYTIYDRWGVQVFQTHNDPYNPDIYCDGCFKGLAKNGAVLTPGVYFYVLQGNYNVVKSGSITIFE